jgi:tetratricopeptide (TPR) repeat protein
VAASAFAQAKRYEEALPIAKRAIEAMNPATEAQLLFLVSLHFQLKQEQEVATLLKRLTKEFPENKTHWLQLAASYAELGEEANALATLDAAYAKKMLSEENELIELSRLYMAAGKPDKCAEVLERHMGDGSVSKGAAAYQRLMMCQLDAKDVDGASATFAKAGDSIQNGELLLELARAELARKQWVKARDAAAAAFAAGGMRSTAEAHLLLGIAHHQTKRKDAALASLGEAKKHAVTAKCAEAWIQAAKGKGSAPSCYVSTPVSSAK